MLTTSEMADGVYYMGGAALMTGEQSTDMMVLPLCDDKPVYCVRCCKQDTPWEMTK